MSLLYDNTRTSKTILGISPGTRMIGLAIIKNGELLERKVKTFKGKWNIQKLNVIVDEINYCIKKHQVNSVVVKSIHTSKHSDGLRLLISAIKRLASQNVCEAMSCTIQDLKASFPHLKIKNKLSLVKVLASNYPELFHASKKEERIRNRYYTKMFEAIACALTYSNKQP